MRSLHIFFQLGKCLSRTELGDSIHMLISQRFLNKLYHYLTFFFFILSYFCIHKSGMSKICLKFIIKNIDL